MNADPLERCFALRARGTTMHAEVRGGVVTFLTRSYIVFVQSAILSPAGMDFGAVMAVTCPAAATATLVMGLWANHPVALAPGMGENFFFAFTVVAGMHVPWQARSARCFSPASLFCCSRRCACARWCSGRCRRCSSTPSPPASCFQASALFSILALVLLPGYAVMHL
jgi:xanthine/uracil/vitamin C permease (AzgA family)